MMRIDGDDAVFSSGRTRYANGGIIGLGPDLQVTEGYDGGFYSGRSDEFSGGSDEFLDEKEKLSKKDLAELSDYMIAEWLRFKKSLTTT